jgi:DNA-binding transcriptional regulator YiaG
MKTQTPANAGKKTVRSTGINAAGLRKKKEALERGERAAARVFKLEKFADGSIRRTAVNPATHRRRIAKEWDAKSEVVRARQTLDLTQEAFAAMLGIGLSTLRSWEQGKREPSGAARMLIGIAIRHPEVLQEQAGS